MEGRQKDGQTGRQADSSDAADELQMRCDAPTLRKKSEALQEDFSVEVNKASCHGGAKRGDGE